MAAALIGTLATTGVASASFAGQPGKIAFNTFNLAIHTANPDGTAARQIAPPDTGVIGEWSPDGARLMYAGGPGFGLWTMWPDGSGRRLVVDDAANGERWSPDGRRIVYFGPADMTRGLVVVNPDGTGRHQLTTGSSQIEDYGASWSPDSKWIAFGRHDPQGYHLAVIRADGSGFHQLNLPSTLSPASGPEWSPIDDRILFTGLNRLTKDTDIFTIRANGTDLVDLTPYSRLQELPSWSHEGSRIAYTTLLRPPHEPWEVAIVASDGSTNWTDPLDQPAGLDGWAPDDSLLLVSDGRYGWYRRGTMNPSTGAIVWGVLPALITNLSWQALNPGLRMVGASGHDQLLGSAKNDEIYGRGGPDSLAGGNGADRITGGDGNDLIAGGYGSDLLIGGTGNDTIAAADHIPDYVNCGPGTDTAWVDASDTVTGCETVHGP